MMKYGWYLQGGAMPTHKFKIGETVFVKLPLVEISRKARTSSPEDCRSIMASLNTE
jgi:hypothetical protein